MFKNIKIRLKQGVSLYDLFMGQLLPNLWGFGGFGFIMRRILSEDKRQPKKEPGEIKHKKIKNINLV